MLDVKVNLIDPVSMTSECYTSRPIDYLVGDLGTTRLSILSLDQREADGQNKEKGQK